MDEVPTRDSLEERVQELQSSSTKRQTELLRTLLAQLESEGRSVSEVIWHFY